MNNCRCNSIELLDGDEAYEYSRKHLRRISHHGGWIQLWKCSDEEIYWEATWVGGEGFDNGKYTLRRLSHSELKNNWSDVVK